MSRFIDLALARPLVSTLLAGGLLVALAAPASGLRTSLPGIESLPSSVPLSQTFDRFQAAFPGEASPATIAVQADDVRAPGVRAAISDLRREAVATGVLFEPIRVDESADGRVARILVPHAGSGTDDASRAAVRRLRESVVPATLGRVPDVRAHVGGTTAEIEDFGARLDSRSPVVFAFVLGLAFLLLLITFRSLVVAAKAVVLNLLSVAAAYGVLVLVFQRGWGASLIGLEGTVDIAGWLPLFLFVILFGLSMDYHVFVLSRIREAVDGGLGTRDAVREGLTRTAGVVTSAAVVMVSVFAIFATLTTVDMKQAGVGLAAAILIDATIVRAVLLPATMCLLGRWNWYLPPWLRWLPSTEAMRTPETQADPFDRGARLPV